MADEVIFHSRTEWQTAKEPVTGPRMVWAEVDTVAIHYTAADNLVDGDPGENASSLPGYMRAMQHNYLTTKPQYNSAGVKISDGYSVGYNFAIDYRGHVWELRGFDIKCAANKGHNDHTVAILNLVDGASPQTDDAVAAIRNLIAQCEAMADRWLLIKGHRELPAATACPGAGLLAQIHAGIFSPRYHPPLPPVPIPPEVPMADLKAIIKGNTKGEALVFADAAGTTMYGVPKADIETVKKLVGIDTVTVVSDELWDDLADKALRHMGYKARA